MFDMLILGYGPAGISAALYGLRAGLSVQLVGKDGGALAKAHMIQNYYGLEKPLSGEQLLEVGHKQAIALGANIADDEITDLMFDGQGFSAKGLVGEYHGKVCIMATGAARNKRPVAGMAELEGHGVSYCAVCDAFFYRQKNVAVLGNGEYALHEVQELLSVVKSVTLLTNGAALATSFPPNVRIENRHLQSLGWALCGSRKCQCYRPGQEGWCRFRGIDAGSRPRFPDNAPGTFCSRRLHRRNTPGGRRRRRRCQGRPCRHQIHTRASGIK